MTVGRPLLARRFHKWLAIFVGAQAVLWTVTGLYMTAVHIDIIHGDHLVRTVEPPPVPAGALLDPFAAARTVDGADGIRLHWLQGRPTYIVSAGGTPRLVDARTGARLAAPARGEIEKLARFWFTGDAPLARLDLVQDLPGEVRGREPPLWRAEFTGWNKPTLYFSPHTGELLARRHELWRVFDFLWMLHIMDYEARENVNNWLLRGFTAAALVMALSGGWLLFYSFPRRRRRKAKA